MISASKAYRDNRFVMTPAQWGIIDYVKMMRQSSTRPRRMKITTATQLLIRKGVRAGGTYGASAAAFLDAISLDGGGDYAVCGPTWTKCQDVVKPAFMHWARPYCTVIRDRYVILKNGVRVVFMGMHNPSAIDGFTLRGGWGDEIKDWKEWAFQKSVERTLTTKGLWMFTTSPNGMDWIFEQFADKDKDPRGIRSEISFTTYDGVAPRSWIDDLASTMDKRMFQQQIMGEYVQFAGQVHHGWDRTTHLTRVAEIYNRQYPIEYHRSLPLNVFMDFNVDPMTGGICQHRIVNGKPYIFVLDNINMPNSNTPDFVKEVERRAIAMGIPERDLKNKLVFYPDPSGKNRGTQTGKSNFHIIEKVFGYKVRARRAAPSIIDRINATNAMILDKDDVIHVYAHPRCTHFNRSMEQLAWKNGENVPDKSQGLDHMSDGFGYYVDYEFPVTFVSKSKMRLEGRRRRTILGS